MRWRALLIINPCIGVVYMLGAYDEVSQACVRDHQLKTIGKLHTSIQIQTQIENQLVQE